VHLFLFVKVREGWGEDPERYRAMGLEFPKEWEHCCHSGARSARSGIHNLCHRDFLWFWEYGFPARAWGCAPRWRV